MNKTISLIITIVLLIGIISAQENKADALVSQNQTKINLHFNPDSYLSFDDVSIGGFNISGIYVKEIIRGIDFKFNNSKIEYLNLTGFDSLILQVLLIYKNASFNWTDVKNNNSILLELLDADGKQGLKEISYAEKNGNDYTLIINRGYDDIPKEYENETNASFYVSDLNKFISNFSDIIVPLIPEQFISVYNDSMKYAHFPVNVTINRSFIDVIINDTEIINVSITYTYDSPRKDLVSEIRGIKIGTQINISGAISYPAINYSKFNVFKVIEILVNQTTDGEIYFNVLKTSVDNPNNVYMYVAENSTWTKLTTTYLSSDSTNYYYKAYTPHFSVFAVMETIPVVSSDSDTSSHHSDSNPVLKKNDTILLVCLEGELRCNNEDLFECKNNTWSIKNTCLYGCENNSCRNEPVKTVISTSNKKEDYTWKYINRISIGLIIFACIVVSVVWVKRFVKNRREEQIQFLKKDEEK